MLRTCVIAALAAFFTAGPALAAPSIFLNGVNIDGIKSKEFKNVTVTIDEKGNIFIIAKGLAVKNEGDTTSTGGGAVTNPGGPPTRRYFLVTEKAAPSMSQYDIDLYVNDKWVRKLLDAEEHIFLEITKHLVQGENRVRLIAHKELGTERRSQSPNHYFRVVIGEGDMGGRNVMITRKLIDYKRSAQETENFTNQFTITVF